jgi:CheY-like chemotaxis protein
MGADQAHGSEPAAPPETFVKQVKGALENLYDFAYLERHPLAQGNGPRSGQPGQTGGQRVRRELMAAIESLNPGLDVPFRAPPARPYNLLHLHYVEGRTIQEAANELGVSLRQAYRDLRHGEESVASILWARRQVPPGEATSAAQLSSIQTEIARLDMHRRPTDLLALLERAQRAVQPLAQQRHVRLETEVPTEPVVVSADPLIAQQILVHVLSRSIQQSQPGELRLTLATVSGGVLLTWRYLPDGHSVEAPVTDSVIARLIERSRWKLRQQDLPDNVRVITLHVATHGPTVLVVDDNEGLVELLDRYLTGGGSEAGYACRVMAAGSGREGLRLARELLPDAIVLDIMMPEMDGWEFLQRLRARSATSHIPVVICSVIRDPELAYSLGASLFLPKPVRRDDVLGALHELGVL